LRLPIYSNGTSQVRRYTWGSVEQFGAALVANLPTLYALRRGKGPDQNINTNVSTSRSQRKASVPRYRVSEEELVDYPHFVTESRQGSCRNDSLAEYGEIVHEASV
jgi:hypothetical protein